ncbi:MAG: DDE-type integrase/transposase/recombinase [Sedimenticola sp.]
MANNKETLLRNYYMNVANPAAYSSPDKVYRVLRKKYPGKFTKRYIRNWLDGIDAYSVQKQVRHKFKTANVRVTSIDAQFDADLSDVGNLANENDDIHFLLFVIDIFSRYLWIRPLNDKKAKTVLIAFKDVFRERSPVRLRVDKGSEFVNRKVKKYMKDNNIHMFTTQNLPKANYVERVQRTVKTALYRYMRQKRSYRYIDDLQKIVENYNATPHRSLNYIAPEDVDASNEADLWAFMYLKTHKQNKLKTTTFKYQIDDLVRISHIKHPFRRSYQQQYTTELFKIYKRYRRQGIPVYRLKDWNDEPIAGTFYTEELNKVSKDANSLFFVEKVLRRRRRGGKSQVYVQWEGYPKSMNSWIDEDQLKET